MVVVRPSSSVTDVLWLRETFVLNLNTENFSNLVQEKYFQIQP